MTKEDLIAKISEKMGGDLKMATNFLDAFLSTIEETAKSGQSVFIPGLGSFESTTALNDSSQK